VVDVSDFAEGTPAPQPRPITINEARPVWPGPGAHSAVKLWSKDWAYVSGGAACYRSAGPPSGRAHSRRHPTICRNQA
jgi:hypothetical protein